MFKPWMTWSAAMGALLMIVTACEEPKDTKSGGGGTKATMSTTATSPSATSPAESSEPADTTDPAETDPATPGDDPADTEAKPKEPGETGAEPGATDAEGEAEGAGARVGAGAGDAQVRVEQVRALLREKKWDEADEALSALEQEKDTLPAAVQKQVAEGRKQYNRLKAAGESGGVSVPDDVVPDLTK